MLLEIRNLKKSIWKRELYNNLEVQIREGEKAALIGRNGTGKTTLFKLITSRDKEFTGEIIKKSGIKIIMTEQEHILPSDTTPLEYILNEVPDYRKLREIVFEKADKVSSEEYLSAIQEFTEKDYYHIEDKVLLALEDFNISTDRAIESMKDLSGGEKRFVELVRIMFSNADLALIDEPTNHMDYHGKEMFINWLLHTDISCIIITHDRDILENVETILELNELTIKKFSGNYKKYLKQNSIENVSSIHKFEVNTKQANKIQSRIDEIDSLGSVSKRMKIMRERMKRQLAEVQKDIERPSFWIDKDTLSQTSKKVIAKYENYKDTSIEIQKAEKLNTHNKLLININQLELGYTHSLFKPISLNLYESDRIRLFGRNGAGKTTFIKYLLQNITEKELNSEIEQDINSNKKRLPIKIFAGEVKITNAIKLGVYEQEISERFLDLRLTDAIRKVYYENNVELLNAQLIAILKNYLFDPATHGELKISSLSGGEKARFQIIKMLVNKPNLLILDEPTNHLDLPSIEVIENFLNTYTGAIIYVSHDSYFVKNVGGKELSFKPIS